AACAIVCTSATTARTISDSYGIAWDGVFIARPGTDPVPPAATHSRGAGDVVHLLSVASVTHRKGHDILVEALARIPHLHWTCTIAASRDREPTTGALIRELTARRGLVNRIILTGEVAEVSDLYRRADAFVLPSRYEGYGTVFAEAMGHGLPVIGTTG